MWSVEYQVTTPSTISIVAMATSAVSSSAAASSPAAASSATSRRQCVGQAPGMLLEDVFELCRKNKDILRWLRQELIIIGDGLNVVTATRSWNFGPPHKTRKHKTLNKAYKPNPKP